MLLLDAEDEEDEEEEEQDGPSRPTEAAAAVASSRLADRFTLTADFVVLFCCCSLLLEGFTPRYGFLLLVGVDASG